MYYLIQKNVFKDPRYDEIFRALDTLGLPYEVIEFKPNSDEFSYAAQRKDIFVYGSVKLAKVASQFDWHPGSFYGGNHQYERYAQGYGSHVINYNSHVCSINNPLNWEDNSELFIKPSRDAKIFTGKAFSKPEWDDFAHYSLNDPNNKRINTNTLIQVSQVVDIIKEARVWIVNQSIVTSCYYKFHEHAQYEEQLSQDGLAFAQSMASLFNVADAYVMDICYSFDGWKIMEVNCINSAGFYQADVAAIIDALEALYC